MHKSACLVACQIDKEEGKKQRMRKEWEMKRETETETGRIVGQSFHREYHLFMLLCLPAAREREKRVLVTWEYDLQICLYVALLSCCRCGTVICSLLFEGTIYRGYCKRGELNCNTKIPSSQQQSSVIPIVILWSVIFLIPNSVVGYYQWYLKWMQAERSRLRSPSERWASVQ